MSAVAHAHASTLHGAHNSWSDTVRVQGPTGTRGVKGGDSGLAEDLRLVSEVESGVNFRPAGGVRGHVAGSLPRRQPGTGTRKSGEMWSRVLKGNARARMLPENPDHLRVRWISQGTYETAWVSPGHDCMCSYQYGHAWSSFQTTNQ